MLHSRKEGTKPANQSKNWYPNIIPCKLMKHSLELCVYVHFVLFQLIVIELYWTYISPFIIRLYWFIILPIQGRLFTYKMALVILWPNMVSKMYPRFYDLDNILVCCVCTINSCTQSRAHFGGTNRNVICWTKTWLDCILSNLLYCLGLKIWNLTW